MDDTISGAGGRGGATAESARIVKIHSEVRSCLFTLNHPD